MESEKRRQQPDSPLRFILVGAGGRGRMWARGILEPFISTQKRIQPVAIVDPSTEVFPDACTGLHLDPSNCYRDLETAFAENEADFVVISSPTQYHEDAVEAAIRFEVDMLIEKPIAQTMEACCRVHRKITASYVSRRAQSRCHSSTTCCHVTGTTPACTIRCIAKSCASFDVPPDASATM